MGVGVSDAVPQVLCLLIPLSAFRQVALHSSFFSSPPSPPPSSSRYRSHEQTRKKETHLRHKRAVQLQIKLVLFLRNTFCLISTFRVEADPLFFDLQLRGTLDVRGLDGEVDNVL